MAETAPDSSSADRHPATPQDRSSRTMTIQELVREHYQAAYRYAYRLTGSAADAEDICQQAFLVAQSRLQQVRDEQKAGHWLLSVVRNCFLKSRRRKRPLTGIELAVDAIPETATDTEIDSELLQAALDDLPDEFRVVVSMFYFEELSYKEIAEALELPIGTVMSRLSRAKGRLRQRLLMAAEPVAPFAVGSSAPAADAPPVDPQSGS